MDINKEDTHKPTKKFKFKTKLYHEILSCENDFTYSQIIYSLLNHMPIIIQYCSTPLIK